MVAFIKTQAAFDISLSFFYGPYQDKRSPDIGTKFITNKLKNATENTQVVRGMVRKLKYKQDKVKSSLGSVYPAKYELEHRERELRANCLNFKVRKMKIECSIQLLAMTDRHRLPHLELLMEPKI